MNPPKCIDSDESVINLVRKRLVGERDDIVNRPIGSSHVSPQSLCRRIFPIAESIAFLLYGGNENETSQRLSRFLREELGKIYPGYEHSASVICQMWRHGIMHSDEPPSLVINAPLDASTQQRDWSKAIVCVWGLGMGMPQGTKWINHLVFSKVEDGTVSISFQLDVFIDHLIQVLDDGEIWKSLPVNTVKERYCSWCYRFLDDSNYLEPKKAKQEIENYTHDPKPNAWIYTLS